MPKRNVTIAELIKGFINLELKNYSNELQQQIQCLLIEFAERFGTSVAEEIDRQVVLSWIDKHRNWKAANTKRMAYARLNRTFNWGVEHGFLHVNRLRATRNESVPWKQDESAGFSRVTDEEFERVLKAANQRFSLILRFLRRTGCTPMELRILKWDMVNLWEHAITLPATGPGSKGSESRIIPVSAEIVDLLREIREKDTKNDGKGFVFTTRSGRQWTRQDLAGGFRRYCKIAGVTGLTLFGVGRLHLYAKGLEKGLHPDDIAALAGLKSSNVVISRARRNLKKNPRELAELQRQFLSDDELTAR